MSGVCCSERGRRRPSLSVPELAVAVFPDPLLSCWRFCLSDWAHRMMHTKYAYQWIHRVHHEFNAKESTVAIASETVHPVEFVVTNLIPFSAGPTLLGVHQATLFREFLQPCLCVSVCLLLSMPVTCVPLRLSVWILVRIGETIDAHCGYDFPWTPYRILPYSGAASDHVIHHSKNRGNFGAFFCLWDHICGTMDPGKAVKNNVARHKEA